MSYIRGETMNFTPTTNVRLLSNVPLDNTYKNTITFGSTSSQSSYFLGKTKFSFSDFTYQRISSSIRVPVNAEQCFDCNYIMYQNTNYANKWFYGFVTEVKYINPETTEIFFVNDVMQTWYFDVNYKPSFVEREHTNDDTIGLNTIPENVELGEYASINQTGSGHMGSNKIVIASTVDKEGTYIAGGYYSGIYSGVGYNVFDNPTDANTFISDLTTANKSDSIVAVFMCPNDFITAKGEQAKFYEFTKPKQTSFLNSFVPKNNKLLTYPYNFMLVTNFSGGSAVFPYEYFSGTTCDFTMVGAFSCNPQFNLYPRNYKNLPVNFNEKLGLDGIPQCTYNVDSFKSWLASNGVSAGIGIVGGAIAVGAGIATGGIGLIALGGVASVATSLAKVNATATLPPQAKGSQSNSANFSMGILDYGFIPLQIRTEYAKIIDEYFNVFGYKTNRVKIPNRTGRASWNYVKTIDIEITGSIPTDDMSKIKSIHNSGVTYWHGDYVGDYTRANNII